MRTLGIVGGIAPESTIDYYRQVIARYRERVGDGSYPSILITSIDLARMLSLVRDGRLDDLTDYLLAAVEQLARGGADVGLLASNTPHIVFDALAARSPIPLISIVEAVAAEAERRRMSRVSLFGTRFTMEGRFYPDALERHGVTLVLPRAEELSEIHDKYLGELAQGQFLMDTRARIAAIANRMGDESNVDAVILGGTELPLLLRGYPDLRTPVLDSTELHVREAVQAMTED